MRYIISILVFIILVSSCKNTVKEPIDPDTYYTCSMDPQVVEHKPGKCPICKMDLTPVKKRKGENQDELELSEQQIQLGNILVDTIRNGTINDQLILTASLNFDQSKQYAVSSRVMGRVEKLYFKNLGEYVKKGTPLYEMYSEDLNNAKQEYLLAIDKKNTFSSQAIIDFDQLIQGAKNKLLLWGLTEMQISELANTRKASPITTYYSTAGGYITQLDIREGDYVMEGGTIVKLADLSTLWVEAQVYSSQLADLQENSMVTVQLPDFNNREIKGKLEFVNPEINQATRINLVRIPVPNPGNYLKPGMSAYVLLKSPRRKSLSLPIDAVIRDGKGATVWVQTGKNTFKNLMVQTGLESDDRIEIISGLSEGNIVVLKGAYLLHSEYIFKKGANPMEGMKM